MCIAAMRGEGRHAFNKFRRAVSMKTALATRSEVTMLSGKELYYEMKTEAAVCSK